MTPARASQNLARAVTRWALTHDTPSRLCPVRCDARRTRVACTPMCGDCARISPAPSERIHLPRRLQAMVEAWERGDRTGR
jgi:hypothetical protein